jgi:hypothetical protein
MDFLDKYIEIDDKHQELIEEFFNEFLKLTNKKEFMNVRMVISSLIANTIFIKNGIYDLYESQNVYSIKILFRSLIEHFLRFQYLVFSYLEKKEYSVFEEYIKYSRFSDEYLYGQSLKSINSILENELKDKDSYEILQEFHPELRNIPKKDFKVVCDRLSIKQIIRYINERINKNNTLEGNAFILKLIPIYSELSAYVHGSIGAIEEMSKLITDEDRYEEMNQALKFSSLICISITSFASLIFIKENEKLGSIHNKFTLLIKEYM